MRAVRRFLALVCSFLGLTCIVGAVIAQTIVLTALHKPTVQRVATAALAEKAVQQRLSDEISVAVLKAMPAAGRTQAAATVIRQTANKVSTAPALRGLWVKAVGDLYDNARRGTNNPIYLDASQLTEVVRTELATINPEVLALLPTGAELQVQVTTVNVPNLKASVQWTRLAPYILGGLGVLFLTLAIVASLRRRRALRRIGWWMFGTGLLLTAAVLAGPRWGLPQLGGRIAPFSSAIAGIGWRLYVPAVALTALGLVLAVLGTIMAARAPENRITRTGQAAPMARAGQPSVEFWDTRV